MQRPHDTQFLSEALSSVEPGLIYPEAKRQYEALVQASRSESDGPIISVSDTNSCLWEDAVFRLPSSWKMHLQTICFAYKTKQKVMHYLHLLGNRFRWAPPLLGFVRKHGLDSAFDKATDSGEFKPCREVCELCHAPNLINPETDISSKFQYFIRVQQRGLKISTRDSPTQPNHALPAKSIFIIPTLPLANPTAFFSCLGTQGSIASLCNTQALLTFPAAMLLDMEPRIKHDLRNNPPLFHPPFNTTIGHNHPYNPQKKEWDALFEHLLKGNFPLLKKEGGAIERERDGYGLVDLSIWCAGWISERGKTGTSEEGKAERVRLRASKDEQKLKDATTGFQKWLVSQFGVAREMGRSAGASSSSSAALVDNEASRQAGGGAGSSAGSDRSSDGYPGISGGSASSSTGSTALSHESASPSFGKNTDITARDTPRRPRSTSRRDRRRSSLIEGVDEVIAEGATDTIPFRLGRGSATKESREDA
ncbi:unnamed protein product [Periconia digitata]|uniref:Uncharacterized protein n=1 Tax=Periconia digitata TaxID=1303443 RepID=A0A9W4XKF8_9PLEO|nr:unnamed protein product [Periconia digitata]